MMRSKLILLIAVILVLSAGVVVGRLWAHWPVVTGSSGKQSSWLADQLDLSDAQQKQMDSIWTDVKPKIGAIWDRRRALDQERDREIQDLLSPAQWAAYGNIFHEFRTKRMELDKQREALWHDAEARSRALLNDAQRKKLDEMRGEMKNSRMRHGMPGRSSHSTTMPATAPAGGHK